MCCALAANISASSANGDNCFVPESSTTERIFSPVGVPPGSRVVITSWPSARRACASFSICVLLPQPSRPSNVMNLPRFREGTLVF